MEREIRAGTLRPLWRGVVVEQRRFLDPWTRAAAALLVNGSSAAICGSSAATLHGYDAITSGEVHVVAPYYNRGEHRAGLILHRGSYVDRDVVELDGLRVVGIERTAADLLCSARAGDGLALVDQVLRRAGHDHQEMRKEIAIRLQRRADPRGTVRAAKLLDLASPAAESPAESRLRLRLVEEGFPIPEVNWPLDSVTGRQLFRLDLAWPSLGIAVEYDGVDAHDGREDADAARESALRKRGWIVVRVRKADLRDFGRVARELRAAFAQRGYVW